MMIIGNVIKKLRLERGITQEQLAEYLGITSRAVSQWECGRTYPDISQLPVLANLLEVSADTLLGIDIGLKEERIRVLLERAEKLQYQGYNKDAAEIYGEGLKEYPDSYRLMAGRMSCLLRLRDDLKEPKQQEEAAEEIIALGEKVLAGCTEDEIRYEVIQILCILYPDIGEYKRAELLARRMPSVWVSSSRLLANIYSGTKRYEQKRNNLFEDIQALYDGMTYNNAPLDDGNHPYTQEEMILLMRKGIDLLDLLFEDGNYGFYRQLVAWTYLDIAKLYARLKDYNNAMENLNLAADHAIQMDEKYDSDKKYTCLLFRGMKYGKILHSIAENDSMHQLKEMEDTAFDPLRESNAFRKLEKRLQEHANPHPHSGQTEEGRK